MQTIKRDRTRTLTLRRKAVAEVNRRYDRLKKVITETIVQNQVLTNATAADPSRFAFLRDAEKVDEFLLWLRGEIDKEILITRIQFQADPENHWLNVYVGVSYQKGAKDARKVVQRQRPKTLLPDNSVFTNPAHVERAKLIYTRVYSQLKGVTEKMEQEMARVLTDGIIQGKGADAIGRELNDRVEKIGKTRSRLIARTEIVNAFNVATLREAENLEEILDEPVMMIWLTSIDGRERDTHHDRNKKVYTKQRVSQLIGEPNCRCSISPYLKDFGDN